MLFYRHVTLWSNHFISSTSQFQLKWRDSWDDWTDKKHVRLNKKVCQDCAWMYVKIYVHLYREYFKSRSESCCPGCWPWDFQPAICVLLKPGSIKRGNLSLLLGTLTVLPLMLHSSAGVQQWQDRLVWFAFSILLNKYCFFIFLSVFPMWSSQAFLPIMTVWVFTVSLCFVFLVVWG